MTEKDRQDPFAKDDANAPGNHDPKTEDTGELGLSDEFLSGDDNDPLSTGSSAASEGGAPGWRDSFTQEFHGSDEPANQTPPEDEPRDPFATGMIDSRELTEEAPSPSPDIWLDHDSTDLPSNDDVLHTGRISIPGETPADAGDELPPEGAFPTQPYRIDEIFDRVETETSPASDSKPTEEISSDKVAKTMMQFTQELPFNLRPERIKDQPAAQPVTSSSTEMPRSRAFSAGVVLGCVLLIVFFFMPWQTGWDIQGYVSVNVTADSTPPPEALASRQISHWSESNGELFFTANSYLWKYHPQFGFARSNHLDPMLETALALDSFRVISRPPISAGYRVAYLAATTDGQGTALKFVDLNFPNESNPNQSGISREYSITVADDLPLTNYSSPAVAYTLGDNPGPWIFVNQAGTALRVFTFDDQNFTDLGRIQIASDTPDSEPPLHPPLVFPKLLADGKSIETRLLFQAADGLHEFAIPDSFDGDVSKLQPTSIKVSGKSMHVALAPFLGLDWDFVVGFGNQLQWVSSNSSRFETVREMSIPAGSSAAIIGLLPANRPGELFAILADSAWLILDESDKQPARQLETQAFTNNQPDRANYLPISAIASTSLNSNALPQLLGVQGKGGFWIFDANHQRELVAGEWNIDVASPIAWNLVEGRLRCDFASVGGTVYSYTFDLPDTVASPEPRILPPPAQVMTSMAGVSARGTR